LGKFWTHWAETVCRHQYDHARGCRST